MEHKSDVIKTYKRKEVVSTFDKERDEFLYQKEKHRIESEFLLEAIKQAKDKERLRVLDVACGTGRMLPVVFSSEKDIAYFGLDTSKEMTSVLKEKAKKLGKAKNVQIKIGDAANIPFEDNFFDIVFSYHLLWHLPGEEQEKMLREMIRVAKKEGFIVFDILNRNFVWEKIKNLFGFKKTEGIYKLSMKEVKEIIQDKKYELDKVLDIKTTDNLYRIIGFPNKIRKLLPKNMFHMFYFKVIKK